MNKTTFCIVTVTLMENQMTTEVISDHETKNSPEEASTFCSVFFFFFLLF